MIYYVFDVDGVITLSKSDIDKEMVECLHLLLYKYKIAFITGGKIKQINNQIITYLNKCSLSNLIIIPLSGAEMWIYENNKWNLLYQNSFTIKEKNKMINMLGRITAPYNPTIVYGKRIEDRGCQITWSAHGQDAPYAVKEYFDVDRKKRTEIKNKLDKLLPKFEIRIGGCSSIDITKKDIDKSYGMNKFITIFNLKKENIIFIGDSLFKGGNDHPIKKMGIKCVKVGSPQETKVFIKNITKGVFT